MYVGRGADCVDGVRQTPCRFNVIVLDKDAIAQIEDVVVSANHPHSVLLQNTQAWPARSRICDAYLCGFDHVHKAFGLCSDSGEPLNPIEGTTFNRKECGCLCNCASLLVGKIHEVYVGTALCEAVSILAYDNRQPALADLQRRL